MSLEKLPTAIMDRIDERCDAFEAAWKGTSRPQLDDYLTDWEGPGLLELFSLLLELDIDFRQRRGESVAAGDYAKWFPQFAQILIEQFGKSSGAPAAAHAHAVAPAPPSHSTHANSKTQGAFFPGAMLADRYRIVALLGRGGMGEVYRAEDLRLGETVALKLLPSEFSNDAARLAFFYDEVRLSRGLTHPNICRVHDLGVAGTLHFLSMEYIDGENLQALLRRIGRLPAAKAAELGRQMAAGLAAAHQGGVLHRDLKPANVMIDGRGHARITDFGLACAMESKSQATGPVGTPIYMAPETYLRHVTSVASDIYSLGLILYEMCVGKRYCRATTAEQLREHHENAVAPELSDLLPDCDPALARLIVRCLDPDPTQRPASVAEVISLLPGGDPLAAALAAGETPSPEMVAAAGSVPPIPVKWLGGLSALLVVGLMLVVGLSFWAFRTRHFEHPPAVLVNGAREWLEEWGYHTDSRYEAWGFALDRPRLRHWTATSGVGERAERPAGAYFWYRSSRLPMAPFAPDWAGDDFLTIDEQRPAMATPGMTHLQLDLQGRLVGLQVIPESQSEVEPREATAKPVEQGELNERVLAAAGLTAEDRERLKSQEPSFLPPMFADRRLAWVGEDVAGVKGQLEVLYAELQGMPVYFEQRFPWTAAASRETSSSAGVGIRAVLVAVWIPLLLVSGLVMAVRNWRAGRGDKRGAQRVACFLAVTGLVHWFLSGNHVASRHELDQLLTALAGAVLLGAIVWMGYLAIEPTVRRNWPQTLVSWTRLVSGRVYDPLVGRDVLIGITVGAWVAVGKWCLVVIPESLGWSSYAFPNVINLAPLHSTRAALGELTVAVCLSVLYGLFFQLLFLMVLRIVLRRWSLAVVVFVVFLSTQVAVQYQPMSLAWGLTCIEMLGCAWLFLRVGLLSVVVMHFTRLICKWPLTWDLSQWQGDASLIALGAILGLAVAAFVAASGRRISLG